MTPSSHRPTDSPVSDDSKPADSLTRLLEQFQNKNASWIAYWQSTPAKDLVDLRVKTVEANSSVDQACALLLDEDLPCLAITDDSVVTGLLDFSDVNAFLALATSRNSLSSTPRQQEIVAAARKGKVPVYLASNLSGKNPLQFLPYDATVISLLGIFAQGGHRVLIQKAALETEYEGIVSSRSVLTWMDAYCRRTESIRELLANPLQKLSIPSLNLHSAVVSASSEDTVLDAMRLMSEEGVSSIAVLRPTTGSLFSAVTVTDIGKLVVPSESKSILSSHLHEFVALIRGPAGSDDGEEVAPVYSVYPSSDMAYAMQKLLATHAHRLFVTEEQPTRTGSPAFTGIDLKGVMSIIDVLAFFARIAGVPDVDPTRMQRRRRASSSSPRITNTRSSPQTSSPLIS